ncbi:MAG: hypothetical protein NVSMB31_06910 [Vulcanimicrobiaceae bacterium]
MGVRSRSYREPWHWLALICIGAIASSLFIWQQLGIRNAQVSAQADAVQRLRLQRISLEVNDFTSDAAQLTNAAANSACIVRNDRKLIEHLLAGLLESRINSQIYGLGCFFEPRVFDSRSRYFGPYAQSMDGRLRVEQNADGNYRYFDLRWYRFGVAAKGQLTAFGPYLEVHRQLLSFLKAFYAKKRLGGVVSVDARVDKLSAIVAVGLEATDSAFVEALGGRHILPIGAPPKAGAPAVDMAVPIRFAQARLHLVSDRSWAKTSARRALVVTAAAIFGIWLLAILLGTMLMRSWRAKRESLTMQADRERLESELFLQGQVEAHLRKAAYTDTLTGLPNRAFVLEALAEQLSKKGRPAASLAFIDIDSFSLINDTLGHDSGDQLLAGLGSRIAAEFPGDVVARLGGDEFAILSRGVDEDLESCAQRIGAAFKVPSTIRNREIFCTASIGMVSVDESYMVAEDVLRDAEIAMYASKDRLRGSWVVFNSGMRQRVHLDAQLDHDLHRAIARSEFVVFYQPIVDLADGKIVSLEALVRWPREDGSIRLPAEFIPYAEAHGMIAAVDAIVMRRVCEELPEFIRTADPLSVTVNCSMAQLTSHDLVEFTHNLLKSCKIDPAWLRLEITETSVMRNPEYALASIEQLRALGVLTLVDDFGTGYSSLSYLQRLPISGVKIDRSFVAPLGQSAQATAIVRSIIALAQTLGLYTVAEGIETTEQLAILKGLGATYGQGYFFSHPVPRHEVAGLLRDRLHGTV